MPRNLLREETVEALEEVSVALTFEVGAQLGARVVLPELHHLFLDAGSEFTSEITVVGGSLVHLLKL